MDGERERPIGDLLARPWVAARSGVFRNAARASGTWGLSDPGQHPPHGRPPMDRRTVYVALAALGLALSGAGGVARAVNASPHAVRVKQPDGTPIVLRLRGNEFLNWYED